MSDKLEKRNVSEVSTERSAPLGFEEEQSDDILIPRIKMVQTLSPERKEGLAEEGSIINSLTKEKLNGKVFIPVFKFNNNIRWKERNLGGGMLCNSRDGKVAFSVDGQRILCAQCKRNEFDNTKQGREAIPSCTKYFNFFGFMEGEHTPIILSFSRTNYNEGKKMYSLAKVTMQNMWNHGYRLNEKRMSKNNDEWSNIICTPAGPTDEEDRVFAHNMYESYRQAMQTFDIAYEEEPAPSPAAPSDVDKVEF